MAGARAVPPAKLSYQTQFVHGVERSERGFAASVRLRKPGDEAAVYIEFLGAHHKREWFAAVCHDLAACKRAFDSGGLQAMQALPHGPGRGSQPAAADRLNFPLSCYTSQEVGCQAGGWRGWGVGACGLPRGRQPGPEAQPARRSQAFWDAMENMRFGQLVRQMLASNTLEKTLFYGDTWRDGLAAQRARDLRSKAHQQRQAADARQAAAASTADSARSGRAMDAEPPRPVAEAAEAAGSAVEERRGAGQRERSPPSPKEELQAWRRVGEPSPESAPPPGPRTDARGSSRPPPVEPQLDTKPAAVPVVASVDGAGIEAPPKQPREPPPSNPPPQQAPTQAQEAGKPAAVTASSSGSEGEPALAQSGGKPSAVVIPPSSSEDEPVLVQRGGKPTAVVVSSSSDDDEPASAQRGGEAAVVIVSSSSDGDEPAAAQHAGKPPASAHVVSNGSDSELAAAGLARAARVDGGRQQQPLPAHQQPPSEQQERPAAEPTNVWLKGSAEFPPGKMALIIGGGAVAAPRQSKSLLSYLAGAWAFAS